MDAFQPSNRYMGAPPPMSDPQHQQHQQLHGPPHQQHHGPPPSQSHWYPPPPPQFQYHQPPPQWLPPPSSSSEQHQHQPLPHSYPSPPVPPYPAPLPHHHQYPPPRPPLHAPPPPSAQLLPPHPYPPQPNQPWGNPNWVRHQGWEYPERNFLHSNEEDWAARARAWAAAKAAMENQHTPSQFSPVGRVDEHSVVYHDQYQQTSESYFADSQKASLPLSSSQQLPVSVTNLHRPSVHILPESTAFGSGPSSGYVSDGSVPYGARDGAADAHPVSPSEGNVLSGSSIYQQEVPSSYSTLPGHEGSVYQNEKLHMPFPLAAPSHHEAQPQPPPTLPAISRSFPLEQPQFMQEDQSTESLTDGSGQPSDFEHGQHQHTTYTHPDPVGPIGGMEHVSTVPSVHSWTPEIAPGAVFPPVPTIPPGPQFDPSFLPPSSVPGHHAPGFGRIPGPSFRPGIPPAGAPFGLAAGASLHTSTLHTSTTFPGDANGVFNVSERPKKASVPNWLREEIIKKKAIIANSSIQDHSTEDSFHSIGAEGDDKSLRKGEQADNKSIDSTKSMEEEEDDEDDVEAARKAAINQEIKRVLTEVLLKVTDELFDEIATKVLSEDDQMVEVDKNVDPANHKASPPSAATPTPKASAKVLIPVKVKNAETDAAAERSSSSSPGDVLGLASYASDDDEVQSSSILSTQQLNGSSHQQSGDGKISEDVPKAQEKGISHADQATNGGQSDVGGVRSRNGANGSLQNGGSDVANKASSHDDNKLVDDVGSPALSRGASGIHRDQIPVEGRKVVDFSHGGTDASASEGDIKTKGSVKSEIEPGKAINEKLVEAGHQVREARNRSDRDDRDEIKKSLVGKDLSERADAVEVKANQKHSDTGLTKRGESRNVRKDKEADERNFSSKERGKDRGATPGERGRESESRKSSSNADTKDDKKETEKVKRVSSKEESVRQKDRKRDEMEDRTRHRDTRDSHRYKRRRSSSIGSRGKDSKDNSFASHGSGSDDEASGNSRQRKPRSNRRSLSPSPIRSRRRQVSRSPHSKHSQRRHSPYSSLENRGRRSRSGTPPVRRRR